MLQAILADHFSFWLPDQASANGEKYDALFYFILAINIIFSSLIMAILVYFVVKYRHREGMKIDPTAGHSTALELTWTIIPTLIVLGIFYFGFREYLHANVTEREKNDGKNDDREWTKYPVTATGQMWSWSFTYPNGHVDPELHVMVTVERNPDGSVKLDSKGNPVVNNPTLMTLESPDVLHDLDIPAFRMKKDVVPGRNNKEWFEPTVKGTYDVYCAMYCGQNHSTMLAKCVVQDKAEYLAWLKDVSNWEDKESYVTHGQKLYMQRGCANCHTTNGQDATGPTWRNMYNSEVEFEGGVPAQKADDEYIEESIRFPAKKIVKGKTNVMPSFDGMAKSDIAALTWYMKSISTNYKGSAAELEDAKNKMAADMMKGPSTTAPSATQPASAPAAPH